MIVTPAHATVDDLGPLYDNGGEHWWRVIVRTAPGWPKQRRITYTIRAYTDSQAGQIGLNRFAEDVDGRRVNSILMV